MADPNRPAYPPPNDYQGYPHHSPPRHDLQRDDNRAAYPPPPPSQDPNRQGQYPPAPSPYQPPGQWAGQPQGQPYQHPPAQNPHYDQPPPQQHPPPYHYPPPAGAPGQPPMHPDYRLPPVYSSYYGPPYQQPQPAPAPRQRTAIACKYCRKRKIRCSGYDSSPDGRCQNCVRFSQQCLFHPVSSQAAFVPASALYGPNARAPVAGQDGQNGQNGQPQQMLYGAHGQPLGPAGLGGQPQYNYPPPPPNVQQAHLPPQHPGYPPGPYHGYPPPPPHYAHGPPPTNGTTHQNGGAHQYEAPPPTATSERSERGGLKRGPPDDEIPESSGVHHSPHPNSRARYSVHHDGRANGSFDYQQNPTSPANSTVSYQSYPPPTYINGAQPARGNNSPPPGLTPNSMQTPTSMQSQNSPHSGAVDNKTPPPSKQPGSAGSSQNGRSGMKVHEMLGNPSHLSHGRDQRPKSDNDMLNKLEGKK